MCGCVLQSCNVISCSPPFFFVQNPLFHPYGLVLVNVFFIYFNPYMYDWSLLLVCVGLCVKGIGEREWVAGLERDGEGSKRPRPRRRLAYP